MEIRRSDQILSTGLGAAAERKRERGFAVFTSTADPAWEAAGYRFHRVNALG